MWPFTRKKTQPPPDRNRSLDCVPVPHPGCRQESTDEGLLLVCPVRDVFWLDRFLVRNSSSRERMILKKIQLDELGSAVWRLIDGRRSVRDISQLFRDRYQLTPREAEIAVATFIQRLGHKGVVALREPDRQPADGAGQAEGPARPGTSFPDWPGEKPDEN